MSRILFFLIAFIAVIFAVLVFAPGVVPVAAYKDRIEAAASNSMGRDVTISDNLSFRILPRVAFHVEDLTIANAEGFEGDYLARVAEADIGVKIVPLFSGAVEVDRFVLTEPDIILARAANGAVNWNLTSKEAQAQNDGADNKGRQLRDLSLGDVRILRGKARYADGSANKTYTADDIDLTVVLNSLSEPLEAKGTMVFQGEPSTLDMVLTSLADVMDKKPANLKLDMKIGSATTGADLTVSTGGAMRYQGPVRLNAPDLPAFAALLGTTLADAPGFDKLSVSGTVDGGGTSFRLSDATINFDEIDAQGVLNLDWSAARPKASGVLSSNKLDLRPYMPPPAQSAQGFPAWSEAPMDMTSLRNIDADFDITADAIYLNDMKIDDSRLKLTISNGRLTADIPELSMYGGQGSGRVVVNARGATPSFSGNFDMGAVEAQPLSLDLLKHDNLLGLGSFKFDFTATGASQAAIMASMDGSGGFDLADGALKGVNIVKIARAVAEFQDGFNPAALQNAVAAARGPDEATDFSAFLSNFTIKDGLVNAPTISLNGPNLTMTGKGTVNLPNQTIDLRLAPRATTTADGEAGRAITVPIKIGGTFAKPTIGVDAESLVRGRTEGALRGLVDRIGSDKDEDGEAKGKKANEDEEDDDDPAKRVLKGIFGGSNDDSDPGDAAPEGEENEASLEETIANEALNAIFGAPEQSDQSAEESADDPN